MDKLVQNAHAAGQGLILHNLGADARGLGVIHDGDAGDSAFAVHAHHHLNVALGTGGHDLDGVAVVLTVDQHLIDGVQGAAGGSGSGGHLVGQFQRIGELGVLGVSHHGLHGLLGVLPVDGRNLIRGDGVDAAQCGSHHQAGQKQCHGQLDDILGVHIDLFLGLDFVAHFAAASFFSDFTTPKRAGLVNLSIRATHRFMIMME